jgi:hypothetical protein
MKEGECYARVFPIEYHGEFFIFLHEPGMSIASLAEAATYGVAHVKRGLVVWKYFQGIEHARVFADFLDTPTLRYGFSFSRYRERIGQKLTDMGYYPLTSR